MPELNIFGRVPSTDEKQFTNKQIHRTMVKSLVLGMAVTKKFSYMEMHEQLEKTLEQVEDGLACGIPSVTTLKNWVAKHFTARYRLKNLKNIADRAPAGRPPVKFTGAWKRKSKRSLNKYRGRRFWNAHAVQKDIKAPVHPKTISAYFRSIGYKKHPRAKKGYKSYLDKKARIHFAKFVLKLNDDQLSRYAPPS